jgi:phosphotriesterase-related protein
LEPVEVLEEMCVREAEEGIHGSGVCAGAIKLGTSDARLTEVEKKAFTAAARAQARTGLYVTTHANTPGAHASQLAVLESLGVDPERVVLGHTQAQLADEWPAARDCMRRGASYCMTNLRMDVAEGVRMGWADAIKRVFDEGLGDHLVLGLDWVFNVGHIQKLADPGWRPFRGDATLIVPCPFMPPPPFVYMFTHVLPRFREMGVTDEMLDTMLVENPKRILPVRL